jgi:3-methyladenine DNA glycosylase AlkD
MAKLRVDEIKKALRACASAVRAEGAKRYFKQPVDDQFTGNTAPQCRSIAAAYRDLPLEEIRTLMQSPYHEERTVALIILDIKFRRGDARLKKQVYDLLMKMKHTLNSWDSVDVTAPYIVGPYLIDKDRGVLYRLARSRSLWDRRIAMVSTLYFIRNNQLDDTFRIAEMLLDDPEDLIHKATGWMLREAGKKDLAALQRFLRKHYARIPRTALRYAIERFPEKTRRAYLAGAF